MYVVDVVMLDVVVYVMLYVHVFNTCVDSVLCGICVCDEALLAVV